MSELSHKNFGLLIAYVLPGFVALWGISQFSPTVESWIATSGQGAPTIAGFLYVTLASLAAGLTVSAVRWAIIDHLHAVTGIAPPAWKFVNLEGKLQGYLTLIENHYRYYQFYANMFVAAAFSFAARMAAEGLPSLRETAAFVALELVLFAGSRDTLSKYYTRTRQLLNSRHL